MKTHFPFLSTVFIFLNLFLVNKNAEAQCGAFGHFAPTFTGMPNHTLNYLLGHRYTNPTNNFLLTGLAIHGRNSGSGFAMAIYNDVSGTPGTLVASTGTGVVGTGTIVLSVLTPTIIPAGTYWIMAVYQSSGNHTWGTASSFSQTISYIALTYPGPAPTSASWTTYTGADFNYWAVSGNMSVSGPTAICAGSSATFAASGATTYSWSTGATTSSIVVSPGTNTVYSVGGSGGTCTTTTNFSLAVNPVPTLNVTAPSTVCAGSNAILMASGAVTYTWTGMPGSGTIVVAPTTNTTFTVTGSANGCSASAMNTITVTTLPQLTLSGSNSVCIGSTITQTVNGTALTYTWGNSSTANSTSMTALTNTFFMVTGAGVGGCTNTAVKNIFVQSLPQLGVNSGSICVGSSFTLIPTGANLYTYPGGGPIVSPPSSTFIPVVGTSVSSGCSNTVVSNITVAGLPTISVNSGSICTGGSFTLVPSGAFTYTFTGGMAVVSPTVSTVYTISGTGNGACVNSTMSTVIVNPLPVITLSANPTPICKGETATVTLSGALSYSLNANTTNSVFTIKPASTITRTFTAIDNNGCSNTLLHIFVVNACTGFDEFDFAVEKKLFVYPNPAINSVTVHLPELGVLYVYNRLGQLVLDKKAEQLEQEINLEIFTDEVYLIVLQTSKGNYTARILKK